MEIAYWAIVCAGAVSLMIEAYRQFSTSDDLHTHDRYPILKDVDLDAMCTSAELLRGFLMYASLYIGAYAVILGSAEVFAIVAGSSGEAGSDEAIRNLVVGARDLSQDAGAVIAPVDAFDLGKPIFVSAAIIAALSMGIFAPVERMVRSYAHWIAAIPRGVYRVISGLKRINYQLVGKKSRSPTLEKFEERISNFDKGVINDEMLENIQASLKAFDVIQPAVTGQLRDQIFTAIVPAELEALLERQDQENTAFDALLDALTEEPEKLQGLQLAAARMCNNMQALFALLYIRNQKSVDTTLVKNPTIKVIEHIQQDREPSQNALSGGIFVMLVSVLILFPLTYWSSLYLLPESMMRSFADMGIVPSGGADPSSKPIRPSYTDVVGFIRNETIIAFLQNGLVFFLCSGAALLSREASKEYGRWKDWELNQVPFMRLFKHSVFPGVVAVIICVLIKLFEYFLTVEVSGSFDVFVRTNWQYCVMNFFFGFFISIAVYVVVDQHENLVARRTVKLSAGAMVPYVVWAFFVQTIDTSNPTYLPTYLWMLREVLLISMPALSFAVAFAILIEWSEGQSEKK